MIDVLVRRRQNNPLLTGEAGVGKTAVVEGLALAIARGDVPSKLADARVLSLDVGALLAGASMKGEFEARLKGVLAAAETSAGTADPLCGRDPHADRRGRTGRYRRCREPAEAGTRARHDPDHQARRHGPSTSAISRKTRP